MNLSSPLRDNRLKEQEPPFFSIIVPTLNRPGLLTNCLQALTGLNYPRDRFEVIVVDDGSKNPLQETIAPFCTDLHLALITQKHSGPAAARNRGAKQARGQFLAFTDDDCSPDTDWLKCLSTRFAETPDHAIGGKTLSAFPHNPYLTASQLLIDYLYTFYNSHHREARFITSNNLALPSHNFHTVGGFDPSFRRAAGEDRELCARWLKQGFGIIYGPEVLVYHAHPLGFYSFCRQHFNYGRGAFLFHQVQSRHGLKHLKIEPLSFYLNMLQYPLSQIRGTKTLLFLSLMIISQGTNAAGFLWEMLKHITRKKRLTSN
jgi:glycosyltransferase involved in cell wall biosynthesis